MPCCIVQHDEVYVYAYTGTWTADWPYTHFTQFLGELLLQNKDKKDTETVVKDNKFKYFRYLAEARAAGIVG